MSHPLDAKEYNELLEKLKSGELSTEENKRLINVLQSTEGRSDFFKNCLFTSTLQDVLSEDPNSIDILKKSHNTSTHSPIISKAKPYRSKASVYAAFSGIAALLLLGLFFAFQYQTKDSLSSPIGFVSLVNNNVWIQRESLRFKAVKGYTLKSGDKINTEKDAFISFTYIDQSNIDLGASTQCELSKGFKNKRVHLKTGKLYADIKPQINSMTLFSNNATTIVLGTRFTLENLKNESQLKLNEGKIRFIRTSDQFTINLHSGQKVSSIDLSVTPFRDEEKTIEATYQSWDNDNGVFSVINNDHQKMVFCIKHQQNLNENFNQNDLLRTSLNKLKHGNHVQLTYRVKAFLELTKISPLRSSLEP